MNSSIDKTAETTAKDPPLNRSNGILDDIKYFFLQTPKVKTLIKFNSKEDRHRYNESIMQRISVDVDKYKMLNIHRIGVEAPASYLFEELMRWNGDSMCWPNHIAKVNRINNKLENIQISLFGRSTPSFKKRKGIFGSHVIQLFMMKALRIQQTPAPYDTDNARYLLYQCSGGYPIGVFSMYVRSSIPERGEKEMSQLFIMVSFNFYGKQISRNMNIVNRIWEGVHNRVTAHVAYRFKRLCEWKFENFKHPMEVVG